MVNKYFYRKLPTIIKNTLLISEGWLIGSAIEKTDKEEQPKDYDIIVTNLERWGAVIAFLSNYNYAINSYGGFSVTVSETIKIDIWPQSFERYVLVVPKPFRMFRLVDRIVLAGE